MIFWIGVLLGYVGLGVWATVLARVWSPGSAICAGFSLFFFFLHLLWPVRKELAAMGRASKTTVVLEEEARQLRALRQSPVPLRKARRWLALFVGGAAVQQIGWWSLYCDLGLWCGGGR